MTDERTEAQWAAIAGLVYQRCNHFDPYMPQLHPDMASAWGRVFAAYNLGPDALFAGVDAVYAENGSGYRPLPKDIAAAARRVRRAAVERDKDLQAQQQAQWEAVCDGKAEKDTPDDVRELESAEIRQHRLDVDAYARRFGISSTAAEERMRAQALSPSSYLRALATQQRRAAPPAPLTPDSTQEAGSADAGVRQ